MGLRNSWLDMGFRAMVSTTSISTSNLIVFQSYLPGHLWEADKQDQVEKWLNQHIDDPLQRKIILIDWCAFYGIPFTIEKARSIGAEELPPP